MAKNERYGQIVRKQYYRSNYVVQHRYSLLCGFFILANVGMYLILVTGFSQGISNPGPQTREFCDILSFFNSSIAPEFLDQLFDGCHCSPEISCSPQRFCLGNKIYHNLAVQLQFLHLKQLPQRSSNSEQAISSLKVLKRHQNEY